MTLSPIGDNYQSLSGLQLGRPYLSTIRHNPIPMPGTEALGEPLWIVSIWPTQEFVAIVQNGSHVECSLLVNQRHRSRVRGLRLHTWSSVGPRFQATEKEHPPLIPV